MKFLCPLFIVFLCVVGVSAQASIDVPSAPKLEVMQKKWRLEVRNPALDEDPFRAVDQHNREESDRRENIRQNEIRAKMGKPAQLPPTYTRRNEPVPRDPWAEYVYEVKLKNVGEKAIRTVTWEYVFSEPDTQKEAGRQQFITKVTIDAGKTKNLVARSASPPTQTVDATKTDKKMRDRYAEQIVIVSVEYVDGTTWQVAAK